MSRAGRFAAAAGLVALSVILCGAALEVGLRFATPQWRDFSSTRFMVHRAVPGYGTVSMGRPGFDGWFAQNNGDFHVHIHINASGLREQEAPAAANRRVWMIGDSFTFGWGVARQDRFADVAGVLAGRRTYAVASPGTDVCGYQALVAAMPADAHPSAAVVGLVLENDVLARRCPHGTAPAGSRQQSDSGPSLLRIKVYLTAHSALYNFLAVSLKRIGAINDLLERIGLVAREHAWLGGFTAATLDRAVTDTAAEIAWLRTRFPVTTPFAVLIIPGRPELRDGDALFARARQRMTAALQTGGIKVLDPFPALKAAGFARVHFAHDGHWTPLGHHIAGEAIARWLNGLPAGAGSPP